MNMEGAFHMPNHRYSTPEYMRRNNSMARHSSSCCCQDARAVMQNESVSNAECGCSSNRLSGMPLAMAYVPWQEWRSIYEIEKTIHCGTIFEELYKPFRGIGGCQ